MARHMEETQKAIAFAEAGHHEINGNKEPVDSTTSGKLLVVGRESIFSASVIDYAIEMGKRMSYEIVALNTAPLSCDSLKCLSATQKKICSEFKTISVDQAQKFRQAAAEHGLSFTHVVKFSDHDRAIEDVQREYAHIEFVISDTEPETVAENDRLSNADRAQNQVFVYSMLS